MIPGIKRLAKEKLQIELSVSLHSANDKQRSELMPINRKYPLAELLAACGQYIQVTNRQITFEYLLIAGVNSSRTAAHQLARLIRGLNCKVNLIPMNPRASRGMQAPDRGDIAFFMDELIKHGARVTLRKSRGDDIQAACGQLRLQRLANS